MTDERTDGGETKTANRPLGLPPVVTGLAPLVLLGILVAAFVALPVFAGVQSGSPLPDVTVSHVTLPNDETIVLHVTNSGANPVIISQVLVNDAYWNFDVVGAQGNTIAPMGSASIEIPYHWTPGWDLETALVLDDGATFHHTIVAPHPTPGMTGGVLGTLALVGVFVGIVPVLLGMLWYPAMRELGDRWIHATLLFAAGVLAFLAFDAGFEALEIAEDIPGAFEGNCSSSSASRAHSCSCRPSQHGSPTAAISRGSVSPTWSHSASACTTSRRGWPSGVRSHSVASRWVRSSSSAS
ncbi:hypothetical protein VB779_04030 [Haloarculaceae archaeon H-GB11]|nr:hypothetical protein [Haloarculaceae archaeon H-GB11]